MVEVGAGDREQAVDLNGETLQGDDIDLADLRGQVVVINVWGSWCGPCRAEMPMLVEAEDELPADETAFVGINIRDASTDNAIAFERDLDVDYPSIYDPGSVLLDEFGRYTPYAPPTTLVLDRKGRVAALVNGPLPSKSTLITVVEDVLAEDE